MKKIKSTILSLAALTATPIISTAGFISCASTGKLGVKEYHILDINDLHGAVPGFGEDVTVVSKNNPGCFRFYKEAKKIMNQYPGSVMLSAGDENSGDSWSTSCHGFTTYPILRAMGIPYCAVGNHAFEWGYNEMNFREYDIVGRTLQTQNNYFVTSNIFHTSGFNDKKDWILDETDLNFMRDFAIWNNNRVKWADPYKILNFNDAKVCLIGLTTTGTIVDGNASVTKDLSFVDYKASIHYTKYLARTELGDDYNKIDAFILFTHCASEQDQQGNITGEMADLAKTIDTRVDSIISAHSHKVVSGTVHNDTLNKDIPIVQAGTAGQYLGDTKLVFDHSKEAGNKLQSISTQVHKIDVPTEAEQAKTEWNEYCTNPSEDLKELSSEFVILKNLVNDIFSKVISEVNLTAQEMQPGAIEHQYDGYYNGIKYAKDVHGEPVQPGHAYYDNPNILDHFGGWIARAFLLGYYYQYYETVHRAKNLPGCVFSTQDTTPSDLKNGDLKVREVYDMIPYDNKLDVFYINIFQLANIINYLLSGKPNEAETEGFKYHDFTDAHMYQPDLRYYVDINDAQEYRTKPMRIALDTLNANNDDLKIKSSYVCSPLNFYGVAFEVTQITDAEKDATLNITQESYIGNPKAPLYDKTAKYRVATESEETTVTVGGRECKVHLPKISVFEYKVDADGNDNLSDLDDSKSSSWKPAKYWATEGGVEGSADTIKPITCLANAFMFSGGANKTGGNNQCNCLREYSQWSIEQYGTKYQDTETELFTREFIQEFCRIAAPKGRDWSKSGGKSIGPLNISWDKIKALITGLVE